MLKFKKSEIHKLANQLTCNSELFGDEVASVIAQLTSHCQTLQMSLVVQWKVKYLIVGVLPFR